MCFALSPEQSSILLLAYCYVRGQSDKSITGNIPPLSLVPWGNDLLWQQTEGTDLIPQDQL